MSIQEHLPEGTLPREIVRRVLYLMLKLQEVGELGPYRVIVGFKLSNIYVGAGWDNTLGSRLNRFESVDEVIESSDVGLVRLELL